MHDREILSLQSSAASSSSNIASVPLSSTRSVLLNATNRAVAFEVLVGDSTSVRPCTLKPRRLRKIEALPQSGAILELNTEVLAAEEKKLRQLERNRVNTCNRAEQNEPNGSSTSSRVTAERMAAQQATAAGKRAEEMENKQATSWQENLFQAEQHCCSPSYCQGGTSVLH